MAATKKPAGKNGSKGKKKKRNIGLNRVIVVVSLAAIIVLAVVTVNLIRENSARSEMRTALERTTFFDGIYINGVHVGGLTINQARSKITGVASESAGSMELGIIYEDMSWKVESAALDMSFNTEEVLAEAYAIGRKSASLEENYQEAMALKTAPAYFTIEASVNAVELGDLLDEIAAAIDVPVKDATVEHFSRDTGFVFSQEVSGIKVNKEALRQLILDRFMSNSLLAPVTVPMDTVLPEVTKAELEGSYNLIAKYQSDTTNNSARNQNITLALQAFDGTILAVGEEFSINEKTGERTEAKGYQEAGAIKDGVLIPEFGGGVCQVSTSLFNAVVRADLEVTERNNHSYPISYVPIGMDAMIDFPAADFKFINNTDGALYIAAWFDTSKRQVNIELYGIPRLDPGVTIDMRSEIYETIPQPDDIAREDATIPMGEVREARTGRTGYRTNTYKQYYNKDGVLMSEELLWKSYYKAIAAIYSIGTGPIAVSQ